MRSIKLALALVAALVLSVAMTASASAFSFLSSVSEAKPLLESVASQVFKTKAGEVKCSEAKIEAGETAEAGLEVLVQLAEIHYSSCLAFNFIPTTLTNADYLFISNGTVHIDNEVIIVGGGCEVKVPPQEVSTVKYSNLGNNIKLEPNVSGILYTAKSCPIGNGEFKDGTYTGNSEAMISGGKLSFMEATVKKLFLEFTKDPEVWKNGEPLKKPIKVKNISGENLTWVNLLILNTTKPTYFNPMGFAKACPAQNGAFAKNAFCEPNVEIEPWVAGERGFLEVEFKDGAGVTRKESDPLETK